MRNLTDEVKGPSQDGPLFWTTRRTQPDWSGVGIAAVLKCVLIENDVPALYHDAGGDMRRARLLILLIVAASLAACLSAPSGPVADPYARIIDFINDAPEADLVDQTRLPMLFDAELVVLSGDVETVWAGLRLVNFEIGPDSYSLEPAASADYARIADSFDMRTFFSPEAGFPPDAMWIHADSSIGPVLILLGEIQDGLPLIYGITRESL